MNTGTDSHRPADATLSIAGFIADFALPIASTAQWAEMPPGQYLPRLQSRDRTLSLLLFRRDGIARPSTGEVDSRQSWVVGSSCDVESNLDEVMALGNGVHVQYDPRARSIAVQASIVGLPAVYVYETADRVVLSSDLWLIRQLIGKPFRFDPTGLNELLTIGHPVGFRTLFDSVRVIPGGHRATLSVDRGLSVSEAWETPTAPEFATSGDYASRQTEAFLEALRRIQTESTFLSLTAGIDSRTVLAGLLKLGRRMPVRTMSWKTATLDARVAGRLCAHYGLAHEVVTFDETLARRLPELAIEASRRSGGLASVAQAHEVAFYETQEARWHTRLSGHLGNQVGRGGVEAVSHRGCDLRVLSDGLLQDQQVTTPREPGPAENGGTLRDRSRALLENATFFSLGNYSIGHSFATQESPYSHRNMIEAMFRCPPRVGSGLPTSAARIRLRDLGHRFSGEPIEGSFQRMMVCDVGGFIAECPVNWGWKPSGGWSVRGLQAGVLSFGDALTGSVGLAHGRLAPLLTPLVGRHNFVQVRRWCTREYLYDTLTESRLAQGLLSVDFVESALARHFRGEQDAFKTLEGALDLIHAATLFTQPDGGRDPRSAHRGQNQYSTDVTQSASV